MYVLQLTITDFVFLSMLPLFAFYRLNNQWEFGLGLCRIGRTLQNLNYNASVFFLMAMSVDRYVAVAYNTRAQQLRTRRRTAVVCACVWLVALVMSLPSVMYTSIVQRENNLTLCTTVYPDEIDIGKGFLDINLTIDVYMDDNDTYSGTGDSDLYGFIMDSIDGEPGDQYVNYGDAVGNVSESDIEQDLKDLNWLHSASNNLMSCHKPGMGQIERTWTYVQFVLAFLLPFAVITVSYYFIVRKLRQTENRIASAVGQRTARVRKRVTRMVAVLVICFVICWLPYYIMQVVSLHGTVVMFSVCDRIKKITVALAYANSAVNPILYTFLQNNFGERLRESWRNTKKFLLPSALTHKIKSTSIDCKRPSSVDAAKRKSIMLKTTNEADVMLASNQTGAKNTTGAVGDIEMQRIVKKASPGRSKKKCESVLIPCDTEMTPIDDERNPEEEFSAL